MEEKREVVDRLDLSGASIETVFSEGSLQDISVTEVIENMESSPNGAFDSDKIKSAFHFNCNEGWVENAKARSNKRFEKGMGVGLLNSEKIEFKPVSIRNLNCNKGHKL